MKWTKSLPFGPAMGRSDFQMNGTTRLVMLGPESPGSGTFVREIKSLPGY